MVAYKHESRQWYQNVLEDIVFLLVTYRVGGEETQKTRKSYLMISLMEQYNLVILLNLET